VTRARRDPKVLKATRGLRDRLDRKDPRVTRDRRDPKVLKATRGLRDLRGHKDRQESG